LLPEPLLRYSIRQGRVVPHYLTERDHPWLRSLIDEHDRFVGRKRRELGERMREPLPCDGPPGKRALAARVLGRVYGAKGEFAIRPEAARAAVFAAAAAGGERQCVLDRVAARLGLAPDALEDALFADLPDERHVVAPDQPVGPADLANRANLALTQGFLFRSTRVELDLLGNARAVVRHAKLRGLICTVSQRGTPSGGAGQGGVPRAGARDGAAIEISGPLSVLRRTLLYGRALAELVPLLGWCSRFRLRSECVLRGQTLELVLASGDPVLPSAEPRLYDSRLEERFARDFRRLAPEWDVIREPEPIEAGAKLFFPDFLLRHRREPDRRYYLEIIGFWTPDYLSRKLADIRAAALENLILCVDEERNVGDGDLPPEQRVIRFRRWIDAARVRAML
jgi:predicted nuclease of restriction endonuclease-like RecB superfamily